MRTLHSAYEPHFDIDGEAINGYDTVKLNSYDDHYNGYAAFKDFMHP